jgi:hypothetical protein
MTTADGLVVMEVRDQINPALAGHEGCAYTSPPQQREHALSLVALLLSCPSHLVDGRETWTTSVAGGRRTITLTTIDP